MDLREITTDCHCQACHNKADGHNIHQLSVFAHNKCYCVDHHSGQDHKSSQYPVDIYEIWMIRPQGIHPESIKQILACKKPDTTTKDEHDSNNAQNNLIHLSKYQ